MMPGNHLALIIFDPNSHQFRFHSCNTNFQSQDAESASQTNRKWTKNDFLKKYVPFKGSTPQLH